MKTKEVRRVDCYKAVELASNILKKRGFVLRIVSKKSEARYFGYPGYVGLLRVATHGQKKAPRGLGEPVLGKITFNPDDPKAPMKIRLSNISFYNRVTLGVGQFFLGIDGLEEEIHELFRD